MCSTPSFIVCLCIPVLFSFILFYTFFSLAFPSSLSSSSHRRARLSFITCLLFPAKARQSPTFHSHRSIISPKRPIAVMSLFSKLTKNNDKSIYPWSQRKLGGGNSAFPRFGHATTTLSSEQLVLYGGMQPNGPAKKDLYLVDTSMCS